MRYRVLPYQAASKSAKVLAEGLGGLRIKQSNSKFRPGVDDVVINWGSSYRPQRLANAKILNAPEVVAHASNKLTFFTQLAIENSGIIPKFWTDQADIPDDAFPIVCRTILNGHSGEGIVIADSREQLVNAPLYVKYFAKDQEYRVHVAGGSAIAVQRKARKRDVPDEDVNWQVRNHNNGFVFVRNDFVAPEQVIQAAIKAVEVMGLDFGAADVVYKESNAKAKVLEVNTAPGLEGQTINDYVKFFKGE